MAAAKAALVPGNLLCREDRQTPCAHPSLLQAGPSSKTALVSSLKSLLSFAHFAFAAFPHKAPLPTLGSVSALQLGAPGSHPSHTGRPPPCALRSCRAPNTPKTIKDVERAQAACEVHVHWARHVLEEPPCASGRSPCAYFCLGNPGKSSRALIQEQQKQTGIASI